MGCAVGEAFNGFPLSFPLAMRAIRTSGVFLELTPERVPNVKQVYPIFYDSYERKAVGFNYVDYGIVYRKDAVPEKIELVEMGVESPFTGLVPRRPRLCISKRSLKVVPLVLDIATDRRRRTCGLLTRVVEPALE